MFCANCGRELRAEEIFCPACGTKNPAAAPVPEQDSAPAFREEPTRAPSESVSVPAPDADPGAVQAEPAPAAPAQDYGAQEPMAPVQGYGAQEPMAPVQGYGAQEPMAPVQGYGSQEPVAPVQGYGAPAPAAPYPGSGAPVVPPTPPRRGKGMKVSRRPGKKAPAIVALAVGLAVVLGLGIWGLIYLLSPAMQLRRAVKKSEKQLVSYLSQMPNMEQILKNLDSLTKKQAFTATLEGYFQEGDCRADIDSRFDYSRSKKALRLDLDPDLISASYNGDEGAGNLSFYEGHLASVYANSKQVQFKSEIATDGEVYSLPLKDLGKKWNDSDLADVTDTDLPEDLSIDPFNPGSMLEDRMKTLFGKDWTRFERSVKVKTVKASDSLFDDAKKGKTYTVSWDEDALEELADAARDLVEDHEVEHREEDYGYTWTSHEYDEEFTRLDYNVCSVIIALDETSRENDLQLQFFVQKGCLVGLAVSAEIEDSQTTAMLLLQGRDNPWEEMEVTTTNTYRSGSGKKVTNTETYTVEMDVNSRELDCTCKYHRVHYNGEGYDDTSGDIFAVQYDDKTGRITGTVSAQYRGTYDDYVLEDHISLTLKPEGKTVQLELDSEYQDEIREEYWDSYWEEWSTRYVEQDCRLKLTLTLGPQTGKISPLSKKPTDLLSLDEDDLEDLATDCKGYLKSFRKSDKESTGTYGG